MLFVLPAVIATGLLIALSVLAWPRVGWPHLVLAVGVFTFGMRVRTGLVVGRRGLDEREVRRWELAQASGEVAAFDATDDLDGFARLVEGVPLDDAGVVLPKLTEMVQAVSGRLGIAAPSRVELTRASLAVAVAVDGGRVVIGTPFLMVASEPELRAELARQLAPQSAPDRLALLRAARTAVTAARLRIPGLTSRLDVVWAPAAHGAKRLETAALGHVTSVRSAADAAAVREAGAEAAASAGQRAAVVPELWRRHVAERQRSWSTGGTAVVPHEGWLDAWRAAVQEGRSVEVDVAETPDACALIGWAAAPAPAPVRPRALASVAALDALAEGGQAELIRGFDDAAAAQYYAHPVNELYGAASLPPTPDALDGITSSPTVELPRADPSSSTPNLDLIFMQLDALEVGMVRRDAEALAVARGIAAVAEAPTVRAMAAGVCWLCGDPKGVDRIRRVLIDAPRGAAVLADLIPPLRAAGHPDVAARIEEALMQLDRVVHAPYNLRKMFGRATKIEEPSAPPTVRAALGEVAAWYPGRRRVWFVELQAGDGPLRPAAFVVSTPFLSVPGRGGPRNEHGPIAEVDRLVSAVWPVTRILGRNEMEGRTRKRLRQAFTPLSSTVSVPTGKAA